MPRFAVVVLSLLFALPAVPAEVKPQLPSWFPAPSGYKVKDLKFYEYNDYNMMLAHSPLPKNSGGYTPVHGRMWQFTTEPDAKKADCKKDVYEPIKQQLQRQGFKFAYEDWVLQKGDEPHVTYVKFGGNCYIVIIESVPNPFRVTLKPPAQNPEPFGNKDDIPYVSPLPGSTLRSAQTNLPGSWPQPGCEKSERRGTAKTSREYKAPGGVSDEAVMDAYVAAFRAAGWDPVCRTTHHEMDARYTKNGRDIGVYIGSRDWDPSYSISVVDTGAGLRAALEKNCRAALYGVNFDFDKATLRPESEPALNQILSLMKDEPKLALEIGGHTDNVGKPDYNLKLSDERAASVKQWLIAKGIAASRLSSHGYGDTQPLVPNNNDDNRAKNRRVEVKRTDCK